MRIRSLVVVATLGLLNACGGSSGSGCGDGLALVGVTVIDGLGNAPAADQCVLICEGEIRAVGPDGSVEIPRGVKEVPLAGRYVMPGMIDMHAHVTVLRFDDRATIDQMASEQALRTLLAFGITTVRNPAAPAAEGVALREAVASGEIIGPRILTAGDALDTGDRPFGPFTAVPDVAALRSEVDRQAGLGVDYVKLYAALPPELVSAAIEASHAHGVEVIGHLQRTTWTEAARLGIDHLTHSAPWSAAYLPQAARADYAGTLRDRMTWLESIDPDGEEITGMIAALAETGVSLDPTLIAMRTRFLGDEARHREHPELQLAPPSVRESWQRATFTDHWSSEDYDRGRAVWPSLLELTHRLWEGGVLMTVGSDFPNPWIIPGVGFHEELQLLGEAGIPPLEVLRMATHNGARALGLETEIGSIEPGRRADLVVLTADPVAHLRNTRAIDLVLQAGKPLKPSALLSH